MTNDGTCVQPRTQGAQPVELLKEISQRFFFLILVYMMRYCFSSQKKAFGVILMTVCTGIG
jgi:hypothetical protein